MLCDAIPQTYGEAVAQFGSLINCEPHEWDNRTTYENAEWLIDALRARVAELEARERWVPVGERLPEAKTAVVVRRGDGTIGAASTCRICGKFHSIVTHWRSLPEGPKP